MTMRLRLAALAGFLAAALVSSAASAEQAAPAGATSAAPPATTTPPPASPPVPGAASGEQPGAAGPAGPDGTVPPEATPEAVPSVAPSYVPDRSVGDSQRAASDHDFVVGRWGIEGRELHSAPFQCGTATAPATCTLDAVAIGVRRWMTRNIGYSLGLAFALGGGSDRQPSGTWASRDTYVQIGPTAGLLFLLGNWRHLAVMASPQLAFVIFSPSQQGSDGFLIDLRAQLEAELHLGFLGLPALSLGTAAGLQFQFSSVSKISREWSLGAVRPESISGVVENLFLRYYF